MAYQARQGQTEHPFKTIRKVMTAAEQTGVWPGVMLLHGAEEYLVNWACGYVRDCVVTKGLEALDMITLSESSANSAAVISACETLPFMSKKKLVVVYADPFFAQSRADGGDDGKALAQYIPDISEKTLLLLVCSKPNKTRTLYKAAEKSGLVFDFTPLDDATLRGWMQKKLASFSKTADPVMLLNFAKANGYGEKDYEYNLYNLENDLKKAAAMSEAPEITRQDLMAAYNPPPQTNAFALIDSAFSGNKEAAFRILNDTIGVQKASQAMGAVLGFIGLICSQLEIMVEASERRSQGQDLQFIAKAMNVNEYRLKKAVAASSSKSPEELRQDLYSAFQMEKDIKSGIMEPRLAFEVFIAGL